MKITVRIYRKGKVIKRLIANRDKWRKVYAKLASAHADRYYIRVEYGKQKDVYGDMVMFANEYEGTDATEAKEALKAFIE